jgi:hypothetical protein
VAPAAPALKVGLVGAALTAALLAGYAVRAAQYGSVAGEPYVVGFPTSGSLNVMLSQGDGQAFAQLATDPSLARPEAFAGQTADTRVGVEAAYRAQRPLLGYLAWALSLGQPGLVGAALVAWAVVGGGLACAGVAALLLDRGGTRPELALVVLALPGSLLATSWLGPELLGLGCAALGWVWWERDRRLPAVCALTVAALTRESMLVVPAALALWCLFRQKDLKRTLALTVPPLVLAAWIAVVHVRFGAWPSEANAGRMGPPLAGLVEAAPAMSIVDRVFVLVNALLAVVAVRHRRDPLAWAIGLFLVPAVLAGWDVWLNRGSINRVMLPAQVFAGVLLVTAARRRARRRELAESRPT